MDQDEAEVHKLARKERGQCPTILTEQTWSIKDLLYGFRENFSCGIQRVVPSGQDGSILAARVANHSARFGSSCPLAELANIINVFNAYWQKSIACDFIRLKSILSTNWRATWHKPLLRKVSVYVCVKYWCCFHWDKSNVLFLLHLGPTTPHILIINTCTCTCTTWFHCIQDVSLLIMMMGEELYIQVLRSRSWVKNKVTITRKWKHH